MTDPNGERAQQVAGVIKKAVCELDGFLIDRFCANPQCKSYGRKQLGRGRFLCRTAIGDAADLLCPDCHKMTRIRPVVSEEISVGAKLARAT